MAGKTKYKVGDTFGNKRIIEYCGSDPKWRVSLWRFECLSCGTISGPVRTATITRKDRINSKNRCCYEREKFGPESPRWSGYKDLPCSYWGQIKYGANKRGLEFDLTMQDMWDLFVIQDKKCRLSGLPITIGYKNMTASLDRINSSLGYTKENIQWLHKDINRMKSDFDQSYFIEICKAIVNAHSI